MQSEITDCLSNRHMQPAQQSPTAPVGGSSEPNRKVEDHTSRGLRVGHDNGTIGCEMASEQ
jgi:hypothetical protein